MEPRKKIRTKWQYRGCHYPNVLSWGIFGYLWRRFLCPREHHLWSETFSGGSVAANSASHYLVCDLCQLMIHIDSTETTYHNVTPHDEPLEFGIPTQDQNT